MPNHYFEGTGVLVLERVTPVIKALFSPFSLDETFPGIGQAYIARDAECTDPQWSDLFGRLEDLAAQLGVAMPEGSDPSIPPVLERLAEYFGASHDEELANLIEHHSFEHNAELDALLLIATCFDDGHHLTAIQFEDCWYCSRPRLFEFGGKGCYLSRQVDVFRSSSQALELGAELHKFILFSEVDEAATLVVREVGSLLAGINDEEFRVDLRRCVAERLARMPAASAA